MPLTQDQEEREHERRMDQMAVNIEQMRSDMLRRQSDFEISQKWETRKFAVQLIAALGTAFAGGVAVTTLVLHLIGKL